MAGSPALEVDGARGRGTEAVAVVAVGTAFQWFELAECPAGGDQCSESGINVDGRSQHLSSNSFNREEGDRKEKERERERKNPPRSVPLSPDKPSLLALISRSGPRCESVLSRW